MNFIEYKLDASDNNLYVTWPHYAVKTINENVPMPPREPDLLEQEIVQMMLDEYDMRSVPEVMNLEFIRRIIAAVRIHEADRLRREAGVK